MYDFKNFTKSDTSDPCFKVRKRDRKGQREGTPSVLSGPFRKRKGKGKERNRTRGGRVRRMGIAQPLFATRKLHCTQTQTHTERNRETEMQAEREHFPAVPGLDSYPLKGFYLHRRKYFSCMI